MELLPAERYSPISVEKRPCAISRIAFTTPPTFIVREPLPVERPSSMELHSMDNRQEAPDAIVLDTQPVAFVTVRTALLVEPPPPPPVPEPPKPVKGPATTSPLEVR